MDTCKHTTDSLWIAETNTTINCTAIKINLKKLGGKIKHDNKRNGRYKRNPSWASRDENYNVWNKKYAN